MQEARVAIFTEPDWIELATETVNHFGHTVVGEVTDKDQIDEFIDGTNPEDIDVALVGDRVTPNRTDGFQGMEVIDKIRERLPGVFVIGYGEKRVTGADVNVNIIDDTDGIGPIIEGL